MLKDFEVGVVGHRGNAPVANKAKGEHFEKNK